MNGIFTVAIGIFSAIFPGYLPSQVEEVSQTLTYDRRISYVLGYFRENQEQRISNISGNIFLLSKDWKRERKKNIRPYISNKKHTLHVWLFQKRDSSFSSILHLFQKNVPQVDVQIQTFTNEIEYYKSLQNIFQEEEGAPDVFLVKNGWQKDIQMYLEVFPKNLFTPEECFDFFFSFACSAFLQDRQMYAVPLFIEPFFLIANKGLLKDDRVTLADKTARDWPAFLENGFDFSKHVPGSSIFLAIQPSAANHFMARFFSTLVLQAGQKEEITKKTLQEILGFMEKIDDLAFLKTKRKPTKSRQSGKNPYDRFLEADTAVLFGNDNLYQKLLRYFVDTKKRKIQEENIRVHPIPTIKESDTPVISAETWALAVPKNAPYKKSALAFLTFMAEEENIQSFSRYSGTFPSRKNIAKLNKYYDIIASSENPIGRTSSFYFEQKFPEFFNAFLTGEKTPEEVADFIYPYLQDNDQATKRPEENIIQEEE